MAFRLAPLHSYRTAPELARRGEAVRYAGIVTVSCRLVGAFTLIAALAASPSAPAHAQTDPPPAPAQAVERGTPTTASEVEAWVEFKARHHIQALPAEARLYYRRGLLAARSGRDADAARLVRGAAALDPTFAAPHLTLAAWYVSREPSQSLLSLATVLDQLRRSFLLQLDLAANATFFAMHALFFGLLAVALFVLALHQRELRHLWEERLSLVLSRRTSRWWAWGFLFLPFAMGFGLAVPALVLLAMVWPLLRMRERAVTLLLAAAVGCAPLATHALARLAAPMDMSRGPFYGVWAVEHEPVTAELRERANKLAHEHPDNLFVQFGHAWTARRAGDLETAEVAYRRALDVEPGDDRALNNLGNILAIRGDFDGALALFERASEANPLNAAAYFNASQVHTRRFDYRAASDAVAQASALDFEMVRAYQSRSGEEGDLPLIDQWIAPGTFWRALLDPRAEVRDPLPLPASWRSRVESAGWPFSIVALGMALLGLFIGLWWQRTLPLRACSNCAQVVCRRCAQRRREVALCPGCAAVAARAENPEFALVLLAQEQRKVENRERAVRTAIATFVPGFGLVGYRSVVTPLVLTMVTTLLLSRALGMRAPFAYEPDLGLASDAPGLIPAAVAWCLVYAVSLLGYFSHVARAAAQRNHAPVKSRVAQATHTQQAA